MSITTEAEEYRERFLNMCRGYIEIRENGESGRSGPISRRLVIGRFRQYPELCVGNVIGKGAR